jgi:hypothetical protein
MTLLSLGPAVAAPLCACLTLLPGYSTGERLFAFCASAFVLACTIASASI